MYKLVLLTAMVTFTMAFSAPLLTPDLPKPVLKGLKRFYHGAADRPNMVPVVVPDSMLNGETLHGTFSHIPDTLSKAAWLYMGRVFSCRAEGCSSEEVKNREESSEYFDYYILFDSTSAILHVEVYLYQASHGHGVTARRWLRQFVGYNGSQSLIPGKTVDAISGATTSVNALTNDIIDKQKLVSKIKH